MSARIHPHMVLGAAMTFLAWPGLASAQASPPQDNWLRRFTERNFSFKWEVMSQFTGGYRTEEGSVYSRQSGGFELLKKFSTATATVAALNIQGRLVRRDSWLPVQNDMEGMSRPGFFPEYHNVYLDVYNVLNPILSESARSGNVGRFNLRVGRFYLPFGINLQSDTHATVLQLSNDRNFGFERDWYTGLYGSLTRDVNYDLYYLLGSGYYPRFKGQGGMLGGRVSLGGRLRNEYGIEGGLAFMAGKRISHDVVMRSPSVAERAGAGNVVRTLRIGWDGRYTRPLASGTLTFTEEMSGGRDESDSLFASLSQLDYLSRSRRWGLAAQYRHFWQDIGSASGIVPEREPGKTDSSVSGEWTWYLRNDPASSRLHWLKFNVERLLERQDGDRLWLFAVQYYFYW